MSLLRCSAAVGIVVMGCVAACGGSGDDTLDGSTDGTTSDQANDAKLEAGPDVAHDVAQDVTSDTTTDAIDDSSDGADAPSDATDASADAPVDSPPDVITGDGGGCIDNSGCSTLYYCEKGNGNCGGTGTCTLRPTACPLYVAPVCGCNKMSYTNSCFCHAAGETEAYAGDCE
jgi:hypothetical protein